MKFHRFEHVNQSCQNLDATREFYQTLFPEWFVRAQGASNGIRWMHFGDRQFYLSFYEVSSQAESSQSTGHIDHVGFVIEDGDAMKALLDQHGIHYLAETAPETKHRIYVSDPDGTLIELVEYQDAYELR